LGRVEESLEGTQNTQERSRSNRCYVGNLSYETRWQGLKDHMRQAGDVVYAEVLIGYDGRSKGCGIVEYSTYDDAQNAIRTLNDSKLDGRLIFVREDREANSKRPPRTAPPPVQASPPSPNVEGEPVKFGSDAGRKIFISNLPYSTTWQDLKDTFNRVGRVIRADVLQNAEGQSRGAGVVLFEKREDAQRAITEWDTKLFAGRPIYVREDKYAY